MMDLKGAFVERALQAYFNSCIQDIETAAARLKVGVTHEAIKTLAFKIASLESGGAHGSLNFQNVLRFVDMGVGRRHPLGGLREVRTELLSRNQSGVKQTRDRGRKPKKIYARIVYGKVTWLQNTLLYGYTEEARQTLIQELSTPKT